MDSGRGTTTPICRSGALVEGGDGVRFTVRHAARSLSAFAVRKQGVVHAYLNRCAHRGVELDWEPGRFFDRDARWLICSTHGALYDPTTGACVAGPCAGGALAKLPVVELDGQVYLASPDELD